MIRALMLDVDGVLVTGKSLSGEHWGSSIHEDLGIEYSLLHEKFFIPYWDKIVTGQAELRQTLRPILAECAPTLTIDRLLNYWFENDAQVSANLLHELVELRAMGIEIHLTTNQEHERMAYLIRNLKLASYVDGCHYSAAMGCRKPTHDFFYKVEKRVGLTPEDMFLIDDSVANVDAALEVGWRAALWTSSARLMDLISSLSRKS
jgi:putative hydrolase of the HAD superfamily